MFVDARCINSQESERDFQNIIIHIKIEKFDLGHMLRCLAIIFYENRK